MNVCRSCLAPILWVRTEKGKAMPIDAEPHPEGNLYLFNGVAHVLKAGELFPPAERYRAHFVTCPQRKEWRKNDE